MVVCEPVAEEKYIGVHGVAWYIANPVGHHCVMVCLCSVHRRPRGGCGQTWLTR